AGNLASVDGRFYSKNASASSISESAIAVSLYKRSYEHTNNYSGTNFVGENDAYQAQLYQSSKMYRHGILYYLGNLYYERDTGRYSNDVEVGGATVGTAWQASAAYFYSDLLAAIKIDAQVDLHGYGVTYQQKKTIENR